MKSKDLKKYLEQLPKAELTDVTLELYKMLPKEKRQKFQLQLLLAHTNYKENKKQLSLQIGELKIEYFIRNAHLQYYLYPNEVISNKARKNWVVPVRKWFKNLTNPQKKSINLVKQAELLEQLYLLLCDACEQEYFLCEDPFQDLGITQLDFYKATLSLWQEAKGKEFLVTKGLELMIFNPLNSYTLYSQLMVAYTQFLDSSTLQRKAIDQAMHQLTENGFTDNQEKRLLDNQPSFSTEDYWHEEVHNNLVELIYRVYTLLGHVEKAIQFFKDNYYERKEEIRLYVLVRLLFEDANQERILYEIENSIKKGIEPRASLMQLLDGINSQGTLPHYL